MANAARRITNGPGFHWFGYYDKLEFDATDRRVLGMRAEFEGRAPGPDDVVTVGMIDIEAGDRWAELGESRAWCWQQGCMLQWLPGSDSTVLWNDREADRFVCRLLDVDTGRRRTIGQPVYAVSPDGAWAVAPDFSRINDMRPGYGYAGIPDPRADSPAPAESGIRRVRLDTGESDLIVSIAEVARIPWPHGDLPEVKHYVNHLLVSPDGSRFVFLHRWYEPGTSERLTRMFVCRPDGSGLRVVSDSGDASHFIWRDPDHVLVYCSDGGEPGMCLIDVRSRETEMIDSAGLPSPDGHFSYLPGQNLEWIVTDGGPRGEERMCDLVLYHLPTGQVEPVASFHLPERYAGPQRVDLHPRVSRDGRRVVVDSAREQGRQLYLVDVGGILDRYAGN